MAFIVYIDRVSLLEADAGKYENKAEAISYFRKQTRTDLKTAKKYVDSMFDGTYIPEEF